MHLDFSWIKSTSRTLLIDLEAPSSERLDLPSRCQGGWAGPLFFASFSWWLVCTRLNHFRPKSIAEKMHLVLAYHSWLDQPRRSLQDYQIPSHHLHQHPAPLVMTTADIFTRSATTSFAAVASVSCPIRRWPPIVNYFLLVIVVSLLVILGLVWCEICPKGLVHAL